MEPMASLAALDRLLHDLLAGFGLELMEPDPAAAQRFKRACARQSAPRATGSTRRCARRRGGRPDRARLRGGGRRAEAALAARVAQEQRTYEASVQHDAQLCAALRAALWQRMAHEWLPECAKRQQARAERGATPRAASRRAQTEADAAWAARRAAGSGGGRLARRGRPHGAPAGLEYADAAARERARHRDAGDRRGAGGAPPRRRARAGGGAGRRGGGAGAALEEVADGEPAHVQLRAPCSTRRRVCRRARRGRGPGGGVRGAPVAEAAGRGGARARRDAVAGGARVAAREARGGRAASARASTRPTSERGRRSTTRGRPRRPCAAS